MKKCITLGLALAAVLLTTVSADAGHRHRHRHHRHRHEAAPQTRGIDLAAIPVVKTESAAG